MTTVCDKSRVLVVDDDPGVGNAMRHLLLAEGYQVCVADEGGRALARFREWRPRLVITDLRMAPMDGFELCRHIRAESNVPIIVVSGEDAGQAMIEALDSGADDYVEKPFDIDGLLDRVREQLDETRTRHPIPPAD
jgi:DNA-binding response OmpR family regulator